MYCVHGPHDATGAGADGTLEFDVAVADPALLLAVTIHLIENPSRYDGVVIEDPVPIFIQTDP